MPQAVHDTSPGRAKVPAGQAEHWSGLVALHGALTMKPAPQAGAQAAHGEEPEALHETPATHGESVHLEDVAFQL